MFVRFEEDKCAETYNPANIDNLKREIVALPLFLFAHLIRD